MPPVAPAPLNDGFDHPKPVADTEKAFPTQRVIDRLMPVFGSVPPAFQHHRGDTEEARLWHTLADRMSANDIPATLALLPREGIDPELAWANLVAITQSWVPKHEHKIAAVAWLAHRWFIEVDYGEAAEKRSA